MAERLPEPVTVTLTASHIDALRASRFFTQWVPDWRDYTSGSVNGIWHAGERLTFINRVFIEPYSGIMAKHYVPSLGNLHSHGLCDIGFQSYSYSPMPEAVTIGRYCSISNGVLILDSGHPVDRVSTAHFTHKQTYLMRCAIEDRGEVVEPPPAFSTMQGRRYPTIGHDVWIGQNAVLSIGIEIGTGAVIAANAVVTKSVPPYAIVGGNPARIIRYRFPEETTARLLRSEWWRFHSADLQGLSFGDVPRFLDEVADLEERGEIRPYTPRKLTLPDDWLVL